MRVVPLIPAFAKASVFAKASPDRSAGYPPSSFGDIRRSMFAHSSTPVKPWVVFCGGG